MYLPVLESCLFLATTFPIGVHAGRSNEQSAVLPIYATSYGTAHVVEVEVGASKYNLTIDTGSANLYIIDSNYTCYAISNTSVFGSEVSKSQCAYAKTTFTPSSAFRTVNSKYMGINYASGNTIGPAVKDTVKLGAMSIPEQLFGLSNSSTAGLGTPGTNGLIGFAWPGASFVHPSNFTAHTPNQLFEEREYYDTVSKNIGKYAPAGYFALALDRTPLGQRGGPGGYLSLGTLPPVPHGEFATVKVQDTKDVPAELANGPPGFTWWTTHVTGTTWGGHTDKSSYQVILDSGTPVLALPPAIANSINSKFDPPGVPFSSGPLQGIVVQCNATPPADVGFELGGKYFTIEPSDLIWTDGPGHCLSGVTAPVTSGGGNEVILGDIFFKNVVAVFDARNSEMRFAQRKSNSSSSSSTSSSSNLATSSAAARSIPAVFVTIIAVIAILM